MSGSTCQINWRRRNLARETARRHHSLRVNACATEPRTSAFSSEACRRIGKTWRASCLACFAASREATVAARLLCAAVVIAVMNIELRRYLEGILRNPKDRLYLGQQRGGWVEPSAKPITSSTTARP